MTAELFVTKQSMIDNLFDQVRRHHHLRRKSSHQPGVDCNVDSSAVEREPAQDSISDQLLSDLFFALQSPLEYALDLIDKEAVTRLVNRTCPGHFVFQVVGTSGASYTCFPETNFCTCPFYKFSVLRKEEFVMCKHVIAARLSVCLETCKDVEASSPDLAKLLSEI